MLEKYAHLLVHYCLELKADERLFIQTTTLAEPLVREIYRVALRAGASVDVDFMFREKNHIFSNEAHLESQFRHISPLYDKAMRDYDAYLYIRAPFNLREDANNPSHEFSKFRAESFAPLSKIYSKRTAKRNEKGGMRRSLCQFPTDASAQLAEMSYSEYEKFVFNACKLFDENPMESWLALRKSQQHITDFLNKSKKMRYVGENIDISFSCDKRTWINSDGTTNMPSGEIYTAPVENSVNGTVKFSFPSIYDGHEVEDVTLWVKNGYVERWEASRGKGFLDKIFAKTGARRFGEAAIGTNYDIKQMTKNILFDEKIGGTIHLAVGQSYLQCGGKNQSSVHWDMITDMKNGGQIFADGEKIYENGRFII